MFTSAGYVLCGVMCACSMCARMLRAPAQLENLVAKHYYLNRSSREAYKAYLQVATLSHCVQQPEPRETMSATETKNSTRRDGTHMWSGGFPGLSADVLVLNHMALTFTTLILLVLRW